MHVAYNLGFNSIILGRQSINHNMNMISEKMMISNDDKDKVLARRH